MLMYVIEWSFVKQVQIVVVKLAVYACFPLDNYNKELYKRQCFNYVCKVNTIIKINMITSIVNIIVWAFTSTY